MNGKLSGRLASRAGPASDTGRAFQWIAFDAVGTLIYADPPVPRAYHETACRHGSQLTVEEISARFSRAFAESEESEAAARSDWQRSDRLITSEQHERQRWRRIVGEVIPDANDPEACFLELFEHFARPEAWRCFPDVGPALRRLRAAGYRLATASNFDKRLHALCDGLPELHPLELRAVSSEIGYRKPSLHFYRKLSEMAGCPPQDILLVGDDEINDIQGAAAAGMPVVKLVRNGETTSGPLAGLDELPDKLGV